MGKIIQIEVPYEVSVLIEKDDLLRKLFERIAVDAFKDRLFKYLIAEELTKDVEISEEEILEIDEVIKKNAWKELKKKWNL